jgi:DNA modification methylase
MPESVTDRCTKAHEYIFLMTKSANYHYDADAIKEMANPDNAKRYEYQFGGPKNKVLADTKFGATKPIGDREYDGKRNKRSVWSVTVKPYKEAHFATFPKELIEPCVLAGCPKDGTILDPFGGSGTTAEVAIQNGRNALLIELNPEYIELAKTRINNTQSNLFC